MNNSDSELLRAALSRRAFLTGVGTVAGLSLAARYGGLAFAQNLTTVRYDKNPFSLGVASGDPWSNGVVLWTRLAPDPLNGGGMPAQDVTVRWQIASDEAMKRIVQQGTATATVGLGHSVHVEVEGLRPATHYWYQFESAGVLSPVGRTKTLPDIGSSPEQIKFAFASCQLWQAGHYAAYRHMATQDLDFVAHLGDYIYESEIGVGANNVRANKDSIPRTILTEPTTLEGYRLRYSLYKLDPYLQATHAAFPFIVTWDDHEVENNYVSQFDQNGSSPEEFLKRRAAAYQAYYEHMPLRRRSLPHGPNLMLYRRFTMGDLMQFNVLDTRQYRSDQANGDKRSVRTEENLDPSRRVLGAEQEQWLTSGMARSAARWNVMAQQVIMSQFVWPSKNGNAFASDKWDGYPVERDRLMQFLATAKPNNPVVLAGDSHTNLVSDLKADFNKPNSPVVGSEFAGTAISSGGYRPDIIAQNQTAISGQSHLKWYETARRGYMSCVINRKKWQTDVWQVGDVRDPNSPVTVNTSWAIEDGKPGVQRVS